MLRAIMKLPSLAPFALASLLLAAAQAQSFRAPAPANDAKRTNTQAPLTAMEAVELAKIQTQKSIVKLVSMRGVSGTPTPMGWSMQFHDPASSTYLSDLKTGGRVQPSKEVYATGESPIYFSVSRVLVDSLAAFEVANKEAAAAKVGFDRINYELRGREFSDEPLWTLQLINDDDDVVGIVHLSAESGKLLRTVWLRRTARNEVRVIDSALSAGGPSAAADSAGASTEPDVKALPPVQNIEPPPAPAPGPAPTPDVKPE